MYFQNPFSSVVILEGGGFTWSHGLSSEPEPTRLAAEQTSRHSIRRRRRTTRQIDWGEGGDGFPAEVEEPELDYPIIPLVTGNSSGHLTSVGPWRARMEVSPKLEGDVFDRFRSVSIC